MNNQQILPSQLSPLEEIHKLLDLMYLRKVAELSIVRPGGESYDLKLHESAFHTPGSETDTKVLEDSTDDMYGPRCKCGHSADEHNEFGCLLGCDLERCQDNAGDAATLGKS